MMSRNLKGLGFALVAAIALSSMAASAASAQQGLLTTDGDEVTLTGYEAGGAGTNFLKAFGLEIECPGSTYTGHEYNATPHEPVPNGATTVTLAPEYEPCHVVSLNWPATIDMNECDLVGHLGQTTGTGDTYGITFDLDCPVGSDVTLEIWTPGKHIGVNPPMCIIHFGETGNQGLAGVHLTDTTNGHVDLTGEVELMDATKTKSPEDPILCPEGTTTVGKLGFNVTINGDDGVGDPTDIGLSHN